MPSTTEARITNARVNRRPEDLNDLDLLVGVVELSKARTPAPGEDLTSAIANAGVPGIPAIHLIARVAFASHRAQSGP